MIESIIANLLFMSFEIFILLHLMKRRETSRENQQWTPFRILLLNSIVSSHHALLGTAESAIQNIKSQLDDIYMHQHLTQSDIQKLRETVSTSIEKTKVIRRDFFDSVQTAGPSMRPYAAGYCSEVLYFFDTTLHYLKRMSESCNNEIEPTNRKAASDLLRGVQGPILGFEILVKFRFQRFESSFVTDVWKTEALHYHERTGGFLTPVDYRSALSSDDLCESEPAGDVQGVRMNFFDPQ